MINRDHVLSTIIMCTAHAYVLWLIYCMRGWFEGADQVQNLWFWFLTRLKLVSVVNMMIELEGQRDAFLSINGFSHWCCAATRSQPVWHWAFWLDWAHASVAWRRKRDFNGKGSYYPTSQEVSSVFVPEEKITGSSRNTSERAICITI